MLITSVPSTEIGPNYNVRCNSSQNFGSLRLLVAEQRLPEDGFGTICLGHTDFTSRGFPAVSGINSFKLELFRACLIFYLSHLLVNLNSRCPQVALPYYTRIAKVIDSLSRFLSLPKMYQDHRSYKYGLDVKE